MVAKRIFWLALLMPQFALLLALAFLEMRRLREDLQGHGFVYCGNSIIWFDPLGFAVEILGIATVIGLCGYRRWARGLYLVFGSVVVIMGTPLVFNPPSNTPSFLPVELIVLATMAMCFSRCFRTPHHQPLEKALRPVA